MSNTFFFIQILKTPIREREPDPPTFVSSNLHKCAAYRSAIINIEATALLPPDTIDLLNLVNEIRPGHSPDQIVWRTPMSQYRLTPAVLFMTAVSLEIGIAAISAVAEDIPESLRIERNAKKAYAQQPVIPIDRGNAHHRDIDGASGGGSPDQGPLESPNEIVPPTQSDPKDSAIPQ